MTNSGELTVKQVLTRATQKDFVMLPYRLYKENPYWVPQLIQEEKRTFDQRQSPFLKKNKVTFFVCYRRSEPVGRIAAIINHIHNRYHHDKVAFFGFFESIDDEQVAKVLFESATVWVKEQGAEVLRGPTNYSMNDVAGLLIHGFDQSPYILMPYNPPFYQGLLEKNGFRLAMRFLAYEVTAGTIRFPRFLDRLERRLNDGDIQIRPLNLKELARDFKMICDIMNQAWAENWGFTPVSFEESMEDFRKVKIFAPHDLILIAEYQGQPAGFAIALPDINQVLKPLNGRLFPFNWLKLLRNIKKINRIRVVLMGVLKEHRHRGIDLMFYKKIVDHSRKYNYQRAELSWILESNEMMNRVLEHINAKVTKNYAIFEKEIR